MPDIAPYPPFSGKDQTCPKCEGAMDQQYQEPGTVFAGGEVIVVRSFIGKTNGADWMLRRCIDCDYSWPEMCADWDGKTATLDEGWAAGEGEPDGLDNEDHQP